MFDLLRLLNLELGSLDCMTSSHMQGRLSQTSAVSASQGHTGRVQVCIDAGLLPAEVAGGRLL